MKEQSQRAIQEGAIQRYPRKSARSVWSLVGGLALVAIAAGLIVNLPDIKRYIRITTM